MPVYRTTRIGKFTVSVTPTQWFRRYLQFIPYLSATNVNLIVKMKPNDPNDDTWIRLNLYRFDGNDQYYVGEIEPEEIVNSQKEIRIRIDQYLVTYGQYNLQILLPEHKAEVVATFSVLERDATLFPIVLSLITLILGSGLTLLVQWLWKIFTS
ncbi:MAG: hypothetical protein NTZ34_05455 [Chloroflexi bacterium]|nr:hypothetical protein [Chloroflexota bacterium]